MNCIYIIQNLMSFKPEKCVIVLFLLLMGTAHSEIISRVIKTKGEVMLKRIGKTEYSDLAKPGGGINNGDAINVGQNQFAVAMYVDDRTIIKIKENTIFQFIDTPNTRTLNIEIGT